MQRFPSFVTVMNNNESASLFPTIHEAFNITPYASIRGDRGELTHFSLKTIFCQNGTSLLNYVGMLVFHAISHVS